MFKVNYERPLLTAKVGDYVFTDVIQFSCDYTLNSIPKASIAVGTGVNTSTGQPASIYKAISSFNTPKKVEVFFADINLGNKVIKIFEGELVGTGWSRSAESASYILQVQHWVGHLNYTSTVSGTSHPGNPADYTFPAIFGILGLDDRSANTGLKTGAVSVVSPDDAAQALDDLWEGCLRKWCVFVSEGDSFERTLQGGNGGQSSPHHTNTKAALARIFTREAKSPLRFDIKNANDELIKSNIVNALRSEAKYNWINNTLWGKLIEWSSSYLFDIVPRIDDVLLVPTLPGYSGEPLVTIYPEDHVQVNLSSAVEQRLRAVGLLQVAYSATNIDNQSAVVPGGGVPDAVEVADGTLGPGGPLGWYQPDGVTTGMVLLRRPPVWLVQTANLSEQADEVEGVNDEATGTVFDKEDEIPEGKGANKDDQAKKAGDIRSLADAYAKQLYVKESLKSKIGSITGRLRFDIAPGSHIKIIAAKTNQELTTGSIQQNILARVMRVSIYIDAEQKIASTVLDVSHYRTETENSSPGFSLDKPPIYEDMWVGASLIKETQPAEEEENENEQPA